MKKIYFLALTCAVLFGVASCSLDDDNDDNSNKLLLRDNFTIVGTYHNYKLIGDNNTIVYPTVASVNELTDDKGFENHKRIQLYAYYEQKNTTTEDGVTIIHNAELQDGIYFADKKVITVAEATEAGILAEDSIFYIKGSNSWLAKGYFSSIVTAEYSIVNNKAIVPHANLCATNIEENAVTLTMLYNRHTEKTNVSTYDGTFYYSFDVTNIEVPGNDSITVTFDVLGATPIKNKVSRKDFYYSAQ